MVVDFNLEQWTARIQAEDLGRIERYLRARLAYNGELTDNLDDFDQRDRVALNYVRPIVDISVQSLIGSGVKFTISDEKAQETFEKYAKKANFNVILRELARNGSIFGHTFAKIVPDGDSPRVIPLAPEFVHVVTDPHDYKKVLRYRIEYTATMLADDGEGTVPVTIRQDITRLERGWRIDDYMAVGNEPFRRTNAEYDATWPYEWSPVLGCPNIAMPNEYYGRSDIEDIIDVNLSLNRNASNLNRLVRMYAWPILWAKGVSSKSFEEAAVNARRLLAIPSTAAEIDAVNIQADIQSVLSAIELAINSIHNIAQVPKVSMGIMERTSVLSALSLQVLYAPMMARIREKRAIYGDFFAKIVAHILELLGYPNVEVFVDWEEPLPRDETQAHNVAIQRKTIGGISMHTILEDLGLDFDKEAELIRREQDTISELNEMEQVVSEGENAVQQPTVE